MTNQQFQKSKKIAKFPLLSDLKHKREAIK